MIPSVIADQVERGIKDFLRTTFPPSNPFFHGILERLFEERDQLFKGPYISVNLPFRRESVRSDIFESFEMDFTPYQHQKSAFRRLTGDDQKSTLISTGTGSGKTECFLYPILDYCYQQRSEPGIKAVIIYPMNALANDQARRIARLVAESENLKGNVTAGLFVGQNPGGRGQMMMSDDMVITNKDTMRQSPPDILLTNYKMLDYLLIRPSDSHLWKDNNPETLKYLVVDELHTFDGAQGTDLACLIRRLKARVKAPPKYLCCIGTSATLGGSEDADELKDYARQIFDEDFDENSVITENRLSPSDFFGNSFITRSGAVDLSKAEYPSPYNFSDWDDYIAKQYELWFGKEVKDITDEQWRIDLGDELKQHAFFRNMLLVLNNRIMSLQQIAAQIRNIDETLPDAHDEFIFKLLESLLALISVARHPGKKIGVKPPFLDVRVQVWMRELRRMVSDVKYSPHLRFSDDLKPDQLKNHLPLVHCRECGAMGWSALKRQQDSSFKSDLQEFYRGFFNYSPVIHHIFPERERPDPQKEFPNYICGNCLHMGYGEVPETCPSCGLGDNLIPAYIVNDRIHKKNHVYGSHNCPFCGSNESLTILGSRSASLLSVVIGQLFSSLYCDDSDRKILAFSDSVQDASHRAGFFEARTFRFNFRTALQKVVQSEGGPIALSDLSERFSQFWKKKFSEEDFVATFIATDMAWLADYEKLRETGRIPHDSNLMNDVEKRIEWEILSEYCFRSRIGRTLEKTGCSIATLSPDALDAVSESLMEILSNEIGGWKQIDQKGILTFLLGFLCHIRTRGAVEFELLSTYINNWGDVYLLNRIPILPSFGQHSRSPAFLTTKRGKRFDTLLGKGTTDSWYEDWLQRSLKYCNPQIGKFADDIYSIVLRELEKHDLLSRQKVRGFPVWSLKPESMLVKNMVDQYQCNHCGFLASAPESERDYWEGMPCRKYQCPGKYVRLSKTDDYYGRLYSTGMVRRIFAGEHTGLLKREKRESLEKRFIEQNSPAAENLLSCTPTLEMGINIGDLSNVLLCSVPPSQSNYIQRIGRSGRRDGNAFNFAMAEGKPHDLYFFEEPEEMIAGGIKTPGVFLNAPAVLERQFVAYCFDQWVETGAGTDAIPKTIGKVLNNLSRNNDYGIFPFNWIKFIDTKRTDLLDRFVGIFEDEISDFSKKRLRNFVEGHRQDKQSLIYKVLNRLHELRKERESLRDRVKQMTRTIRKKESSNTRDQNTPGEIEDLKRDKSSLNSIINSINKKDTFNFFTDEGLLPNYAFPEAGILLRSVIYRKKKTANSQGKYDTKVFEYQRPAATAIHELAPANTFYAEGRKVSIDRVNIELSQPEEWRFCDACSHAVLEALNNHLGSCPKCGSPFWGDKGQKRSMLRMYQVEATTSDRGSRVDDSNDAREPQFYNKQMQVEIESNYIEKAYRVKSEDIPFGFEYIRKADFREINFGSKTGIGETIDIAGKPVPAEGFLVCGYCGKVQRPGNDFRHALTCKYHGKSTDEPLMNYLYLYRKFSSEAIRILLPVTSLGIPTKLHSFIAALYLGLEIKFKGSIDHLATTVMEEPIQGSAIKKQYLVLYDRIPGGTGYLKELSRDGQSMIDLIDCALQALKNCQCQNNKEKDGCYRCLYAYRISRDMAEISRNEAMKILTSISNCRDQLEKIKTVSSISINSLFDSELEARFIEALRRGRPGGEPVNMQKHIVNGKPGWRLKLGNNQTYLIEPQVSIGKKDGVSITSKADFVFYPEKSSQGLPIAVFTDGFIYHADIESGNLRVGEDLAQRMALVRSGNFLTWSLSWKDVESQFERHNQEYFTNYMTDNPTKHGQLLEAYDAKACSDFCKMNALESFLEFLYCENRSIWKDYAFIQAICGKDSTLGFADENRVEDNLERLLSYDSWNDFIEPEILIDSTAEFFTRYYIQRDKVDRPGIVMIVAMPKQSLKNKNQRHFLKLTARLFDDSDIAGDIDNFKKNWNGFIRFFNFMQFLPQINFVTTKGLAQGLYQQLPEAAEPSNQVQNSDEEISMLLDMTSPDLKNVVKKVYNSGKSLPEPGYELPGDNGQVIATAELAWPSEKVAILMPSESEFSNLFEDKGWNIFFQENINKNIDALISELPDREKD